MVLRIEVRRIGVIEDHLKEQRKYIEELSEKDLEEERDSLVRSTVGSLIFSLVVLVGGVVLFLVVLGRI